MNWKTLVFCLVAFLPISIAADPALLRLAMDQPRVIAGLDVAQAKNSPLGQRILDEMKVHDDSLQELLASTGFDPRKDLHEVILMSDGIAQKSHSLILARGTFDRVKITQFLQTHGKVKVEDYRGTQILLPSDNEMSHMAGAIAILDASTAVVGDPGLVRQAIDHKNGAPGSLPAEVGKLVNDWSAKNHAWFVSVAPLRELGVGTPGNDRLLPNGIPTDAVLQARAGVHFGAVIDISGEAIARSDKDAEALADVLRFFRSAVRLNSDKPEASELVKIADSMKVSTSGANMSFSLSVPDEQLQQFFHSKDKARAKNAPAHAGH